MAPPHLNAAADLLDKVMSGPLSPEGAQTSSPAACVGAKVVKALVSFCQKTRFTTNIVMREVKAMEFQGDDFNYSALCASMPQRPVTERQMFALMKSEDEEMGVSANFSPVSDDVINPSSLPSGQEVDSSTSAQISGMFQNVWSLLEECGSGSNSNSSPVSRTVLVCTLFIIQVFKFLVTKVSNVNVLNQLFGHVVLDHLMWLQVIIIVSHQLLLTTTTNPRPLIIVTTSVTSVLVVVITVAAEDQRKLQPQPKIPLIM
ncbi:WSSV148 [White spot syndrome virus]|uniref:WSSV148 n=1 Tax=White spot syndrome virus TaxID=92652 RepID=Q8QTF1_WSSV|nr:WSSV148 [Shrimp white spot syndrome virus]